MPIFEYRCKCCGQVFERLWQGPERREELRCPQCGAVGSEYLEKMVSRFASQGSTTSSDVSCGTST